MNNPVTKPANQKCRVFGAPFDPPNSPERLNLKIAYVTHLLNFSPFPDTGFFDPYDVALADLPTPFLQEAVWMGKMPTPTWLLPRPQVSDLPLLNVHQYTSFLEGNGCWDYALETAEFVKSQILPSRLAMIGVDHSSTGGVLMALAEEYDNLNVIMLDAHFDVLKFSGLSLDGTADGADEQPIFYHCGNFVSHLLEKGIIRPENLWILGTAAGLLDDDHGQMGRTDSANKQEMKKWADQGVHILSKQDITAGGMNIDLSGPTYLSIDMDIGSLSSVFSARYMTCYGITTEEFLTLLRSLAGLIREAQVPFLGLDIMEIDIHFLEAAEAGPYPDCTRHIVKKIFHSFFEN